MSDQRHREIYRRPHATRQIYLTTSGSLVRRPVTGDWQGPQHDGADPLAGRLLAAAERLGGTAAASGRRRPDDPDRQGGRSTGPSAGGEQSRWRDPPVTEHGPSV